MWYVYILHCSDGTLYTGSTTDIPRRLREHNRGAGGRYTRIRLPVSMVYQEPADSRSRAQRRERQIKQLSRKEKEVLIRRDPDKSSC